MNQAYGLKSVLEFHEHDKDQGVDRTYLYYNTTSTHLDTDKQEVDIITSPVWGKMLFLDGTLQSTSKDEIIYHNALVHPLMAMLTEKKNILILGGGEGATAREVLRWKNVERVIMVDYDKELVEYMMSDTTWSCNAFNDRRLHVVYDDAWNYIKNTGEYDGIIIDLTDPSLKTQMWKPLIKNALNVVKNRMGGIVMNAGLYLPWKTDQLRDLKNIVEDLCKEYVDFKYYIYTAFVPSFNGEWTFIVISHKNKFITEPEFMTCIPAWIRRGIRMLDNTLLDYPVVTRPDNSLLSAV